MPSSKSQAHRERTSGKDPQAAVRLPCPECGSKIGNERRTCRTCNNFAQKVLRRSARELARRHPDEYDTVRAAVEVSLYNEQQAGS